MGDLGAEAQATAHLVAQAEHRAGVQVGAVVVYFVAFTLDNA